MRLSRATRFEIVLDVDLSSTDSKLRNPMNEAKVLVICPYCGGKLNKELQDAINAGLTYNLEEDNLESSNLCIIKYIVL
jgi:hypothetical protein